jgi:hypothetical protein
VPSLLSLYRPAAASSVCASYYVMEQRMRRGKGSPFLNECFNPLFFSLFISISSHYLRLSILPEKSSDYRLAARGEAN